MKFFFSPTAGSGLLFFAVSCSGAVNVVQNVSPGATSWPGNPAISTATKVTDSGSPSLSATNNFVITVNPVNQPTLGSIAVGNSQVSLSATGLLGPDYTFLTSTNLVNWQSRFTTNPTAMPVLFADTNRSDAARSYRLQLGP